MSDKAGDVGRLPDDGFTIGINGVHVPIDSEAGINRLLSLARVHGFKLNPHHQRLAQKHGALIDGVLFHGEQ